MVMKLPGGPTQDEVLAISMMKLALMGGEKVVDIGCGTGKVSCEIAGIASDVYAIDRREEAILCTRRSMEEAGISNVHVIHGEALEEIRNIDHLDAAFIGGSGNLVEVLEVLSRKVNGRIVVNAVMIETLYNAVDTMENLGIYREAVHVQVSRLKKVARGQIFSPINPVYIIVGDCGKC